MSALDVAVLGGGITGVTVTRLLHEAGHTPVCLEADARTGGLCRSETIDGFVLDHAGGHILFSKDKEVLDFALRVLEPIGHHTSKRNTWIFHRGRYVQYPFENGLADLDANERFVALRDYVEAQFARRTGAPCPDNFHDWCLWRFGKGICDLFMHPYNRKIWNVDLHELGVEWVNGRVPDAPMEDVIRSALGIRTEGYAHQAVFHYPLVGGFESIVDGMKSGIPARLLRTNSPCRRLERRGDHWLVDGARYDRVVSTIPLQELAKIVPDIPPPVAAAFAGLDYVSMMTVVIALSKDDPPPHSWIYFASQDDGPQNRVTWLSNYSPRNAPPGASSVMAEVTYYRTLDGGEEAQVQAVVDGLVRAGLFRRDQVRWTRTFHNRYAYILYRQGLEAKLAVIRDWCRAIGLDIVGRFGNYSYFNSDACIRAAMDLARSFGRA